LARGKVDWKNDSNIAVLRITVPALGVSNVARFLGIDKNAVIGATHRNRDLLGHSAKAQSVDSLVALVEALSAAGLKPYVVTTEGDPVGNPPFAARNAREAAEDLLRACPALEGISYSPYGKRKRKRALQPPATETEPAEVLPPEPDQPVTEPPRGLQPEPCPDYPLSGSTGIEAVTTAEEPVVNVQDKPVHGLVESALDAWGVDHEALAILRTQWPHATHFLHTTMGQCQLPLWDRNAEGSYVLHSEVPHRYVCGAPGALPTSRFCPACAARMRVARKRRWH
jgi:hypothetical protein